MGKLGPEKTPKSHIFHAANVKSSFPTGIYVFKVDNRSTIARCEICSKLTIKTPEQHQWLGLSTDNNEDKQLI